MWKRAEGAARALAELEIWPVGLAIAASVFSKRAMPYSLGLAALFWGLRWLAYRRLTARTPLDWPLALMALMLPVTMWATAYPELTRPPVLRLLTAMALYYALVNWASSTRKLRTMAALLAIAGLPLALSAPFTVEWFTTKRFLFPPSVYDRINEAVPLLSATAIHPNAMAAALAMLCALSWALWLFARREQSLWQRLLLGLAGTSTAGILLLSQSRGALLSLAASLPLLAMLRWRRAWWALAPLGLAGALALHLIGVRDVLDYLAAGGAVRGLDGRMEVWARAIYAIQDFPLSGIGMGAFKEVIPVLYPFSSMGEANHAHNLFLQLAVDLGIPGLVAWLAMWIAVLLGAGELYREGGRRGDAWLRALGAGLLCSQVALGVHGLVDAGSWVTWPVLVVWALWGLTVAGVRLLPEPAAPSAATPTR